MLCLLAPSAAPPLAALLPCCLAALRCPQRRGPQRRQLRAVITPGMRQRSAGHDRANQDWSVEQLSLGDPQAVWLLPVCLPPQACRQPPQRPLPWSSRLAARLPSLRRGRTRSCGSGRCCGRGCARGWAVGRPAGAGAVTVRWARDGASPRTLPDAARKAGALAACSRARVWLGQRVCRGTQRHACSSVAWPRRCCHTSMHSQAAAAGDPCLHHLTRAALSRLLLHAHFDPT